MVYDSSSLIADKYVHVCHDLLLGGRVAIVLEIVPPFSISFDHVFPFPYRRRLVKSSTDHFFFRLVGVVKGRFVVVARVNAVPVDCPLGGVGEGVSATSKECKASCLEVCAHDVHWLKCHDRRRAPPILFGVAFLGYYCSRFVVAAGGADDVNLHTGMVFSTCVPDVFMFALPFQWRPKPLEVRFLRTLGNTVKAKEVRPWIGICDSPVGVECLIKMVRPRVCFVDLIRLVVTTFVLAGCEVNAPRQVIIDVVFNRRDT